MTTSETSPLSQVPPTSLNDIFNKDPEITTDEEVEIVVKALQADRARFIIEEKSPKKSAKVAADPNLKLDDLDL